MTKNVKLIVLVFKLTKNTSYTYDKDKKLLWLKLLIYNFIFKQTLKQIILNLFTASLEIFLNSKIVFFSLLFTLYPPNWV